MGELNAPLLLRNLPDLSIHLTVMNPRSLHPRPKLWINESRPILGPLKVIHEKPQEALIRTPPWGYWWLLNNTINGVLALQVTSNEVSCTLRPLHETSALLPQNQSPPFQVGTMALS